MGYTPARETMSTMTDTSAIELFCQIFSVTKFSQFFIFFSYLSISFLSSIFFLLLSVISFLVHTISWRSELIYVVCHEASVIPNNITNLRAENNICFTLFFGGGGKLIDWLIVSIIDCLVNEWMDWWFDWLTYWSLGWWIQLIDWSWLSDWLADWVINWLIDWVTD